MESKDGEKSLDNRNKEVNSNDNETDNEVLSDNTASELSLVSSENAIPTSSNLSNTESGSESKQTCSDLSDRTCSTVKTDTDTENSVEKIDRKNENKDIDVIPNSSNQSNSIASRNVKNTKNGCNKCNNLISACTCSSSISKNDDRVIKGDETPEHAVDVEDKEDSVDGTIAADSNLQDQTPAGSDIDKTDDNNVEKVRESQPCVKKCEKPTVSSTDSSTKQAASWSSLGVKRCENCKFTTDDLAIFNSHNVICSRKPEKFLVKLVFSASKYSCSNCNFETSVRKKFEEHVALHLMAEPYICMNCGITFESKKVIETHVKLKHSNESVKCGLKGSKRISQVIEALHSSGKHVFPGRPVGKTFLQSNINSLATKIQTNVRRTSTTSTISVSEASQTNVSSSSLGTQDSDVIFVSSSSSSKSVASSEPRSLLPPAQTERSLLPQKQTERSFLPAKQSERSLLPAKSSELNKLNAAPPQTERSLLPQKQTERSFLPAKSSESNKLNAASPAVVAQQPLLLVPLSNNIFMPIPNVGARQNTHNAVPAMQQQLTMHQNMPVTTMHNQFVNIAPVPVAPRSLIIQGSSSQSNQSRPSIPISLHNVPTNIQKSQQTTTPSNQTRYVLIPQPNTNTIQQSNQRSAQILGQIPNIMFSSMGHTPAVTISNINSVPLMTNKPLLTSAVLTPQTGFQHTSITGGFQQIVTPPTSSVSASSSSLQTSTPFSVSSSLAHTVKNDHIQNLAALSSKSSSVAADNPGNKLFFRKYGDLYICDFCKSETPLEDSFKEHIWKHFHQMQNICKDCTTAYSSTSPCSIVLKVMFGLHNSSTESQSLSLKDDVPKGNKTDQEVVTISDEEDDNEHSESNKANIIDQVDKSELKKGDAKGNQRTTIDKVSLEPNVTYSGKSITVDQESGLDIKITSTFSLSDTNSCKRDELERVNKKELSSNKGMVEEKLGNALVDNESRNKYKGIQTTEDLEVVKEQTASYAEISVEENTTTTAAKSKSDQPILAESNTSGITDGGLTIDSDLNDFSVLAAILNGPKKMSADKQLKESKEQNEDPDKTEISAEIDRKPITFPLVAFYKCGFSGCMFDAGTSQDFRDHLNQVHKNATEYKCAHCGHKSFTEDSHVRHLLFHSKPQNTLLFHCAVIGCRFKANLLHVYKEHLEQAHQDVILYKCHSCKDEFNTVEGLVEHLQKNLLKFVQCPYCTMKDGLRRNVVNHIANYHPGKPRQINVTSQLVCQERESNEFEKSKQDLLPKVDSMKHTSDITRTEIKTELDIAVVENDPEDLDLIKRITSNSQIMSATYYKCNACSYIGIGQAKLNKHLELHTSGVKQTQRVFVCPECPHSTNTLQQFISHLNLHIGGHVSNIYTCQHCGFGTNMSNKIHHHISTAHDASIDNENGQDYTERVVKFSVEVTFCKDCRVAFKTKQAHRDHVLKTHGITTNESSGKDDFEPQNTVPLDSPLENEEDNHPRRFTCNECGWGTRKLSYLKSHIKRHYPGQDRTQVTLFRCNYCEYTSTSKLIISSHSQKRHGGKLLRVRRVVETVYITDTPEDDMSIDKFHCDLCAFSCDKISGLQSHLMSCHSDSKVVDKEQSDAYSGPKQQFIIPYGTVFKDFVGCSLCPFKTKKRIDLLRHVKSHPSLEFVTETASDGQSSDKIQNPLFESYFKLGSKRKSSFDGNGVSKKPRLVSPTIDYDRILMDSAKRDMGLRKQVATKSTTTRPNMKAMLYHLGGDQLHKKLKPCYSECLQSPNYTCLICSDVFNEKYALHKHILQHMNVYFYKCSYCDHGTLDSTSIMVHIQRVHRRSIQYNKLDVEEIDSHVNKAIHHMKSQVSDGKSDITFEEMRKKSPSKNKNEHTVSNLKSPEKPVEAEVSPQRQISFSTPEQEEKNPSDIKAQPSEVLQKLSPKKVKDSFKNSVCNPESENTDMKIEKVTPKQEKVSQQRSPIRLRKPDKKDSDKPVKEEQPSVEKHGIGDVKNIDYLHPRLKRQDGMIVCTICDFKDTQNSAALKHIWKHSNVRRCMCSICLHDYVSRWRGDITKHIDLKHRSTDAECLWDDVTPDDITYDGKPFNALTNIRYLSDFTASKPELNNTSEDKKEKATKTVEREPLKMKLSFSNVLDNNKTNKCEENFRRIFKCLICQETFKSKYAIFKHIRLKCNKQLYGCSLCKFKDTNEKGVKMHLKMKHESANGEVVLKTRQDKIRFYKVPNRESLDANVDEIAEKKIKGSVSFKCIACKRTFKTRNACLYHAISQLCNNSLKKCSSCDFRSVSGEEIDSHIKKQHKGSNAKTVELPKEAKVEMVTTSFSEKIKVDSTGKITYFTKVGDMYYCSLCDFATKKTFSVVQHQNMHRVSPCFGCQYCGMKSNWTNSMRNHMRLRHPKKKVKWVHLKEASCKVSRQNENKVGNTDLKTKDEDKQCVMYKCLQCGYKCESYSGIYRHIKRTESCNVPRFKCTQCSKLTSIIEEDVKEHIKKVHNSKDSPEICSVKEMTKLVIVTKRSSSLDENDADGEKRGDSKVADRFSGMKDVETKIITCPVLSCSYKDKVIKVIEHYRRMHPYKIARCRMCPLSSKSIGILFKHFQEFHKLEDYFSTSFIVCSASREELKEKRRSEKEDNAEAKANAQKVYLCNRCDYGTKVRHDMKRHIFRHVYYKRFSCRLCKNDFFEQIQCETHLSQVHNTSSEEFDEVRNERLEKEVDEILETNVTYKSVNERKINTDTSEHKAVVKIEKNAKKKKTDKLDQSLPAPSIEKGAFANLAPDAFIPSTYIQEVVNSKTNDTEYLCTKCPYKSIARSSSCRHSYKHMPKCMKCPYCSFHCYPRADVTRHIKLKHPDKAIHVVDLRFKVHDDESKESYKSPKKKRKLSLLDFDAEIFTSEGSSDEEDVIDRRNARPNLRSKHLEKSPTDDKVKKTTYKCHICDFTSDVLYLFRQHLTLHPGFTHQIQGTSLESKNKCGYCGYISTSSKEFDAHMERHLNSRPYNCPYCQFSQYTHSTVRNHIMKVHPNKKVEVLKDSSSSFLTGDGKVRKTMLVNFEPKVKITDIFTMESELFENLLISANVNVIDLHSIPDDQFGNVSKLLGVNGDDASDSASIARPVIEESDDGNANDVVDGACDMDINDRKYCDDSDDETHIAEDEPQMDCDDISDVEDGANYKSSYSKVKIEPDDTVGEKSLNTSEQSVYEDISDTEMEDSQFVTKDGEKFIVKSELTYEDISDEDNV